MPILEPFCRLLLSTKGSHAGHRMLRVNIHLTISMYGAERRESKAKIKSTTNADMKNVRVEEMIACDETTRGISKKGAGLGTAQNENVNENSV